MRCAASIASHGVSGCCGHSGGVRPALPYTILCALGTPGAGSAGMGAEVGWDDWLASPGSASATQQWKRWV